MNTRQTNMLKHALNTAICGLESVVGSGFEPGTIDLTLKFQNTTPEGITITQEANIELVVRDNGSYMIEEQKLTTWADVEEWVDSNDPESMINHHIKMGWKEF